MGQKINPTGFRLAVNRNWSSKWYANNRSFVPMLAEDIKVRSFLKKKLAHASVGRVLIERPAKDARITIFSARPGVVIGKKVDQAINILAYSPKKGASLVKKLLESAVANAEHNDGADIDVLKVKAIHVERGSFQKRFQARAKGRGARVLRHSCHIYLTVGD